MYTRVSIICVIVMFSSMLLDAKWSEQNDVWPITGQCVYSLGVTTIED